MSAVQCVFVRSTYHNRRYDVLQAASSRVIVYIAVIVEKTIARQGPGLYAILQPLREYAGVTWVSLQKGHDPATCLRGVDASEK